MDIFTCFEEQQQFEEWAFGSTSIAYNLNAMHSWNSLHGDKLWLSEDESVTDCLKKMKEIWMKETKKG